ncbi:2-hydroxyacid dehydrogenase [Flavilitoribacter nigricans]|uniref:Phosphoglycerate dehydrogenase n=1 Tax=Flavilitoribacter nigricans (strain ATCC 23147 / DSM 23189 / NBRC 102662 / NCIMB 1420 / SS-2) TaxID=1122177 RepID=A0A2D0N4A3_FLAN2|nr:hydroxyacid dehydrogenase [Flavilitoribacter nigricans]PHN03382.1 phosphoglycerate dehydrogenase [Flavilitoribacter nigricans DSM 23189 = NBRC 102662]
MKKNVLLLESVSDHADLLLNKHLNVLVAETPTSGIPLAEANPVHAIVTRGKGDVSEALIAACPKLEVISRCGVGLDNVNVDAATRKGIKVVNAPGINADTVAEHALTLMLALQRQLFSTVHAVKANNWDIRKTYDGDEIRGKTLGILGLGNIGKKVARLASAFGMSVVYWDAHKQEGVDYHFLPLEELLYQSDIMSLHLPLVPGTHQLIDEKAFGRMRPNAILINTSRGEVIDQQALIKALDRKLIAGFGADVLAVEPPATDDPLLQMDNVLITPHSASLTARTYNEMCVLTVQNTIDLLDGKAINQKYIFNHKEL